MGLHHLALVVGERTGGYDEAHTVAHQHSYGGVLAHIGGQHGSLGVLHAEGLHHVLHDGLERFVDGQAHIVFVYPVGVTLFRTAAGCQQHKGGGKGQEGGKGCLLHGV